MRVHIISDAEGVAGIVTWEQTTGGEPLYEEGHRHRPSGLDASRQFDF